MKPPRLGLGPDLSDGVRFAYLSMIPLALLFALVVAAPQSNSTESQTSVQERAPAEYERHKQAAIRINELAGRIHSEADASAFVAEIAGVFAKELPAAWATSSIRQRVAHAEYEATSDPAKFISEQRIAEVWNQYVQEIAAPEEAIISTAEIHNMRDAEFTVAQLMWARGNQTVWTMPNVYALRPDNKVADGCRAVETVRVIYDLENLFQNLRGARDRLRKGIVPSEQAAKRIEGADPQSPRAGRLEVRVDTNPIRLAEQRYVREHGSEAYGQLLMRLFGELFPRP
jgi:hypothetical protein